MEFGPLCLLYDRCLRVTMEAEYDGIFPLINMSSSPIAFESKKFHYKNSYN